jgi:hypothetical protein
MQVFHDRYSRIGWARRGSRRPTSAFLLSIKSSCIVVRSMAVVMRCCGVVVQHLSLTFPTRKTRRPKAASVKHALHRLHNSERSSRQPVLLLPFIRVTQLLLVCEMGSTLCTGNYCPNLWLGLFLWHAAQLLCRRLEALRAFSFADGKNTSGSRLIGDLR